jgi:hypothetical protein
MACDQIRCSSALAIGLALALSLVARVPQASAELVTFSFTAVLDESPGWSLPLPVGQKVSGYYTFDLDAPITSGGGGFNTVTFYEGAIKKYAVTLEGVGAGSGTTGLIYLGNPVQTTGSWNYLSDAYYAAAEMTGITISTTLGDRHLNSAIVRLQDLDMEGLDSEALSATPPDLQYFLDNTTPPYPHDYAELLLGFDAPWGGYNHTPFRLTSLRVIPEPSAAILTAIALAMFPRQRRQEQK